MSLLLLLLAACNRSENQIVDQGGQTYSSDGSVPTPVEYSVIDGGNAVCTPPSNNNGFWEAISDDNFLDEINAFLSRFSNNKGSSFMGVRWSSDGLNGIYTTPNDINGISSSDDWTQNPFQNQDSSGCEVTPDISAELKRVLGLDRDASALVFLTNNGEDESDYLVFTTYNNDSCTLGAYLVHSDDGRSYDIVNEEQIEEACDEAGAVEEIMSRITDFASKYGDSNVEIYVPK